MLAEATGCKSSDGTCFRAPRPPTAQSSTHCVVPQASSPSKQFAANAVSSNHWNPPLAGWHRWHARHAWTVLEWVGKSVADWLSPPLSCMPKPVELQMLPFLSASRWANANPTYAPLLFPTITKKPNRPWMRLDCNQEEHGRERRRLVPTIVVKRSHGGNGWVEPPPTNIAPRHWLQWLSLSTNNNQPMNAWIEFWGGAGGKYRATWAGVTGG